MKKFMNNLQIVAMMALIPAMVIAYLNTDNTTADQENEKTEIVRKGNNLIEVGNIIDMVKTY